MSKNIGMGEFDNIRNKFEQQATGANKPTKKVAVPAKNANQKAREETPVEKKMPKPAQAPQIAQQQRVIAELKQNLPKNVPSPIQPKPLDIKPKIAAKLPVKPESTIAKMKAKYEVSQPQPQPLKKPLQQPKVAQQDEKFKDDLKAKLNMRLAPQDKKEASEQKNIKPKVEVPAQALSKGKAEKPIAKQEVGKARAPEFAVEIEKECAELKTDILMSFNLALKGSKLNSGKLFLDVHCNDKKMSIEYKMDSTTNVPTMIDSILKDLKEFLNVNQVNEITSKWTAILKNNEKAFGYADGSRTKSLKGETWLDKKKVGGGQIKNNPESVKFVIDHCLEKMGREVKPQLNDKLDFI